MAKSSAVIAGIVLGVIFAGHLVAAETEETVESQKSEISAGAGVVVSSKPFDGIRSKTYPVPLFTYEGERLYLRGIAGGYRLLKAGGWSIGPTLRPRFEGYEASDSLALAGMKNRNPTIDAGIDLAWRTDWGLISAVVVTDILGAHDGHESELSYTALVPYAGFNIIPSVAVRWRSSNLTNYYYGVRESEARTGRPAYTPNDSVTPVVRVAVRRKLSHRWGLLLGSQYEWLGSEIRDSPIVEDDYILSLLFGITYTF